jgi:HlyD family secretion protein
MPASRACAALCLALLPAACASPADEAAVRASGFAEATEVRVAPEVGGRLVELAVDQGARVAPGDVLARLDTTDTELAIRRARADQAQAQAQLRLLEAPPHPDDVRQLQAQAAAVAAEADAVRAELQAARADLARFDALLTARAGTEKARDDAAARVQMLDERLRGVLSRGQAAEAALARLQAGSRRQELDVARARIAAAEAQLATLDDALDKAVVRAPIAGVVIQTLAEAGEVVAPRAPVLVIVDLDRAWATVYVGGPVVPTLVIGQPAVVLTDAPGHRLDGRITYISPRAEFTPRNVQTAEERAKLVYRVRIAVDNREGILKPGMPVEAELFPVPGDGS